MSSYSGHHESRCDTNCSEASASAERDEVSIESANVLSQEELSVHKNENGERSQTGVFIQHSSSLHSIETVYTSESFGSHFDPSPKSIMIYDGMCHESGVNNKKRKKVSTVLSPKAIERLSKMKSKLTDSQQVDYFMNADAPQLNSNVKICYPRRSSSRSKCIEGPSQKVKEIVERLSRPTKKTLYSSSHLSQSKGRTNEIAALRRQRSDPFPNLNPSSIDISETGSVQSRPMSLTHSKVPKVRKVEVDEFLERLTRPTKAQLSQKADLEMKMKALRLKDEVKSKLSAKGKRKPKPIASTDVPSRCRYQEQHHSDKADSFVRTSSLGLLLSSNMTENKKKQNCHPGFYDRFYGKLYLPHAEAKSFEKKDAMPVQSNCSKVKQIQPEQRTKTKKKVALTQPKPVHLRLYNTSMKYQKEGKELRSKIEEKKRKVPVTMKKISVEKACRLYYLGMESIMMKKKNVSKNEGINCHSS